MKHQQPPRWATRFFRWYCNDHLADAVLGDMLELYARRRATLGKRRANLLFVWNVLLFFQPFALRKKHTPLHINNITMFRNYFKITLRAMSRQKKFTAIKIGGFAIGLATCFVIALFIRHELSYDKHYAQGELVYRIYNEDIGPDAGKWTAFPPTMTQIIKNEYPDVEIAGRLLPYDWYNAGSNLFRRDDGVENTYEEGFAYADQELLQILEIPMVYGNPQHALDKPNTMVISKRKADKYFPGEDPVGKTVFLDDNTKSPFTIGGVMENFAPTSHLYQYDFFITLAEKEFWPGEQTSWCCWNYNPYVRLRPGTDVKALEKKLLAIRDTHYMRYLQETGDKQAADVKKYHRFRLQPVGDIHLYSEGIGDIIPHGDIRYVWMFGGIACFILLLACVNFINLSTAKSANRAKEVGLRKVVGSQRSYLVSQFLTESLLFSFVSFFIGILVVWIALPYFNQMAGKTLTIPWQEWWLYPLLLASAFIVGVLAGLYPSFYLSAFKPIDVLKGALSRGSKSPVLRSAMVVFQFTTSIVLIIGTIVIYRQMDYILHTKIGYDKDQVVMIQGANTLRDNATAFKAELLKLSEVQHVTSSSYLPVMGTKRDQNQFWKDGKSKEEKAIGAQCWYVDPDYIETLGIRLLEGRNFSEELASDSQAVVINQAMAKALGLKNAVGERIMNRRTLTVVGVVEDFHFESMRGEIGPLCFVRGTYGSIVSAKVTSEDMTGTIRSISGVWNRFMPNQPIRYTFLDESYARMYADVQRMGDIFACFAILAILVACLGLFALSAFMVEQRTKEISIRLVLGASLNNIFRLLTQSFVVLVLISFIIAVPLAWYMMQQWLMDYKYRIDITWDVFVLSGILAVVIAMLTISYQAIRAALANPATSLRSE